MNKLEQLKKMTTVVADTGDVEAIKRFQPVDATTNPSLILKAVQLPQYQHLLHDAKQSALQQGGSSDELLNNVMDNLAVAIGKEILSFVPGRVSTEVDSRLSFNSTETIKRARYLVSQYEQAGINKDRILIKIASTWEGIRAAEVLEKDGINCNLTLLFGFSQAAACADAGVYLISPFVGRILDWYKHSTGKTEYAANEDPGVLSVTKIYNYYKQHDYKTVVMGASFRNIGEIEELAGCDRLTISPQLMEQLEQDNGTLSLKLAPNNTGASIAKLDSHEQAFRWQMNEDAMATEKLAEGIRNFTKDQITLEQLIQS